MMAQRFSRLFALALLAFVLACGPATAHAASTISVSLSTPLIVGNEARTTLELTHTGDLADTIETFQVSVNGSDLDDGGTFSRYSFDPSTALSNNTLNDVSTDVEYDLVDASFSTGTIGAISALQGAAAFTLDYDPMTPEDTYTLGEIVIDLTGVPLGTYNVAVSSDSAETDFAGTISGSPFASYATDPNGTVDFTNASQTFSVVPLPGPAAMLLGAGVMLGWRRLRR